MIDFEEVHIKQYFTNSKSETHLKTLSYEYSWLRVQVFVGFRKSFPLSKFCRVTFFFDFFLIESGKSLSEKVFLKTRIEK